MGSLCDRNQLRSAGEARYIFTMQGRYRRPKSLAEIAARKAHKPTKRLIPLDEHDEPMLSRMEAVHVLGLGGRQTVVDCEKRGELRSVFVYGQHWFPRSEVLRLLYARDHRWPQAYKRFAEGASPMDVVIELNMEPEQTSRCYAIYVDQKNRFEQQRNMLLVQLPDRRIFAEWAEVYGASTADFTPARLLRAMELCLADPTLRAQLDADTVSRETGA